MTCTDEGSVEEDKRLFTSGNGVTDVDGNNYPSIVLGEQEWMATNLKTTKYSNGDPIQNVPGDTWGTITNGAWCYYNNDGAMNSVYGKLYNWYAVINPKNICPSGWRIPDDNDWSELVNYLGGEDEAGGKMKGEGTQLWNPPNDGATNASGFNGVPGGGRRGANNSAFDVFGTFGRHWSSSQYDQNAAWGYDLTNDAINLVRNQFNKSYGFSCRCIRD